MVPGVDDGEAGASEIRHVAGGDGETPCHRDRRDLDIGGVDRKPFRAPLDGDTRIGFGGFNAKGQDAAVEIDLEKALGRLQRRRFRRPSGIRNTPSSSSA